MTRPIKDGYSMPPEWAPHSRCWMAWPCREALWSEGLATAREAFAEVAKAISHFEPVTMIANPDSVAEVSIACGPGVNCLSLEHDDSWMRDTGPTFLVDGKGGVAGVDWKFNGWGGRYEPYDKDTLVAERILKYLELPRYEAPLVMEGGAIHVDGEGTLIATEDCLLNSNRNPELSRSEVEQILKDHLAIETIIWLRRGLEDDETDGHVDNLACFARPGVVLALSTADQSDSNHTILQDNLEILRGARDAKGRALEVIEIEQPRRRDGRDGRRLSLSYINFYLPNGGVIVPAFEDPQDDKAYEVLQACFPDREVVLINALDIVSGGGGIHCITQQQPRAE